MPFFKLFAQRPLVLPLALAATVAMVAISEVAHWQSVQTLQAMASGTAWSSQPGLQEQRESLLHTLMLGRIGVAVLSVICLLALVVVLRQGLALQQRQLAQQLGAQVADHRVRQLANQKAQRQLEAEVAQRTLQLTELTQHLQTARDDERGRLARELHDELGALLTSAKLDAARIRLRLAGTAPEALERLAHLTQSLDQVIAFKRRITEDLSPSSLVHLGLVATLEILAGDFAKTSGTPVHCSLQEVPLTPAAELTVYRLVQEAMTNISKYAQASQVWLSLARVGEQVQLQVRDDGVGFDPGVPARSAHGLLGMRYRVQAEQGGMVLSTAPGGGTQIDVVLPAAWPLHQAAA